MSRTPPQLIREHADLACEFPAGSLSQDSIAHPQGCDWRATLSPFRQNATGCDAGAREGVELQRDSLGSVEELQLETRVMCSPGLEVEVELAAPLALGRSVGDDDLDRVIVDLVGNAAPAVEEIA
jgi:glutamate dehydrogenase/leucine dehydrogenase